MNAYLSQWLDVIADGMDVVGCIFDEVFSLSQIEAFDVGIVQIWLEPKYLLFVTVDSQVFFAHPLDLLQVLLV